MNITRICISYTPARQAQKVNFGEISSTPWLKRTCGLSDEDMSMLNDKCPKTLDVSVADTTINNGPKQRVRACITYKNKERSPKYFCVTINNCNSYAIKQSNKEKFMKVINSILERYNK